jgi:hypothetical protein
LPKPEVCSEIRQYHPEPRFDYQLVPSLISRGRSLLRPSECNPVTIQVRDSRWIVGPDAEPTIALLLLATREGIPSENAMTGRLPEQPTAEACERVCNGLQSMDVRLHA